MLMDATLVAFVAWMSAAISGVVAIPAYRYAHAGYEQTYVFDPRRQKGVPLTKQLVSQFGNRNAVLGCRPGPRHDSFCIEHRDHRAAGFLRGKPKVPKDRSTQGALRRS
jgi:hypothetical protein